MASKTSRKTHVSHHCRSIVISCMDFRLRKSIGTFIKRNQLKDQGFDRVAIAGGVKNLPFILDQVTLSVKLHHIDEVYLINHEDCGAYAEEGSFEKHKHDLLFAKEILTRQFSKLRIVPLYLKLNGTFVQVDKKKKSAKPRPKFLTKDTR